MVTNGEIQGTTPPRMYSVRQHNEHNAFFVVTELASGRFITNF